MIDIGNRIREIRTAKKITVSRLAQEIGVAQSFVSGIEAGTKKCSLENLDKICHALGITLHDFFAPSEDQGVEMTPDMRQIIDAARRLTPRQRKILLEVMEEWLANNQG
ncbi:helix-turn-helix domain-containing protein [Desulfofundulus thermobenzoicus]|uniref:Helix-turn-helix domain-containing protein n=1 Tax=Desulfofundulus thermobenzoicus TaxID=29376 RepID=A0A6N7IVR5_9FIRM|nr:helix-turn-helix transcriptional regulator [Desulfofundulus thermobenzoicus]MQL53629.1 helix-turn-helix domain-containing protein [Desulfofundulus thermobenzoicus]